MKTPSIEGIPDNLFNGDNMSELKIIATTSDAAGRGKKR